MQNAVEIYIHKDGWVKIHKVRVLNIAYVNTRLISTTYAISAIWLYENGRTVIYEHNCLVLILIIMKTVSNALL